MIDLRTLSREEREVWNDIRGCGEAIDLDAGEIVRTEAAGPLVNLDPVELTSIAAVFQFELGGVPKAIQEELDAHDPDRMIAKYWANVRAAREGRPKPY